MKRLFIYLAAAVLYVTAAAAQNNGFRKCPLSAPDTGRASAPRKAAPLDGTLLWGYNIVDKNALNGVGLEELSTYEAAYFVPGDGVLRGASISGVNVPVWSPANLANVSVWVSETLNSGRAVVKKAVDTADLTASEYNAIAFDEPYAIPVKGVWVGITLTVTKLETSGDKFPIMCGGDDIPNGLWLNYTGGSWGDYSDKGFGAYAMQLFISGMEQPEYYASFIVAPATVMGQYGEELAVPVTICSDGKNPVNTIDYTVDVNGTKTQKRMLLRKTLPAGMSRHGYDYVRFTAPHEVGTFTPKLYIDKVNGEDNPGRDQELTFELRVTSRQAVRKSVVEEMTGTGCGYCPRGWVGMEALKENRENFIGIAVHQYNKSDPMYVADYYSLVSLGLTSAPACNIDRKSGKIDPYYGSSGSIFTDFDKYNEMMPDVAVEVSGAFNSDFTAVDATANVEYLVGGGSYTVAFVLTADDLQDASWVQSNYTASSNPEQTVGTDPRLAGMADFCKGGIYGQSAVRGLTFNDVMIGSSYKGGGNMAPRLTGGTTAGSIGSASYSVPMPASASLMKAIKKDKVYVVALVIDKNGTIANAERARVSGGETAISSAKSAAATVVERYTASGQRITSPAKGLNIVRMSDGTVRKINVEH